MSNNLVILGWRPTQEDRDSRGISGVPTDIYKMVNGIPSSMVYNRIFIIGENFSNVDSIYVDIYKGNTEVVIIPASPGHVFMHSLPGPYGDGVPGNPYGIGDKLSKHQLAMQFLKNTSTHVTYICLSKTIARDIFELAALTKTSTFENRLWAVSDTPKISHVVRIPDIFNGNEDFILAKDDLVLTENDTAFKKFTSLGINHLRMFLAAGYHERDNKIPVDGWVLQISSPWISLIVSINQIIPRMQDSNIQRDLFENSQMRQLITERTLLSLSNYFVYVNSESRFSTDNVPIITKEVFQDKFNSNWYSRDLWDFVYKKYTSPENTYF